MAVPYPLRPWPRRVSGVHGFEHAEFEPEVGVVEVDPATGEIPVVVVNTMQPHQSAIAALRAWRGRVAMPLPLLTVIELIKENPIGAAIGAIAAAAVTTSSVAITMPTVLPPPPPSVVITHTQTSRPDLAVPRVVIRSATAPRTPARRSAEKVLPRPARRAMVPSPAPTPRPLRRPSLHPTEEPSSIAVEPGGGPTGPVAPRLSDSAPLRHEPAPPIR